MWWECSECGNQVERPRAPVRCNECGTAGVIFVVAEADDANAGRLDTESMRAMWLNAGLDQARLSLHDKHHGQLLE